MEYWFSSDIRCHENHATGVAENPFLLTNIITTDGSVCGNSLEFCARWFLCNLSVFLVITHTILLK